MSCQRGERGRQAERQSEREAAGKGYGKLCSVLRVAYMKMIMNYFMACLNAFMSFLPATRQTHKRHKL